MENELIAYLQLLRSIPPLDIEAISNKFRNRFYKEGDYLLEAGKICREMFFVCKGVLRIMSINEKAVELTHYFHQENSLCCIIQSFNDEIATPAAIQAACNTEVLYISKRDLLELYEQVPYLKGLIDHFIQQQLINKVNIRNMYLGEDAENKYKMFITQNPEIALRIPQNYIASYLGITPQSLSRIRKNIR
jgi:CRP-like cAMP-binding protein